MPKKKQVKKEAPKGEIWFVEKGKKFGYECVANPETKKPVLLTKEQLQAIFYNAKLMGII